MKVAAPVDEVKVDKVKVDRLAAPVVEDQVDRVVVPARAVPAKRDEARVVLEAVGQTLAGRVAAVPADVDKVDLNPVGRVDEAPAADLVAVQVDPMADRMDHHLHRVPIAWLNTRWSSMRTRMVSLVGMN